MLIRIPAPWKLQLLFFICYRGSDTPYFIQAHVQERGRRRKGVIVRHKDRGLLTRPRGDVFSKKGLGAQFPYTGTIQDESSGG